MSSTPKNRVTKALVKPRRRVGRPARYTPELAARICGLIATGSTLRVAAKTCGISWRTVARWNVERPEFRAAYEQARETRTLLWAEECIDIVDNATGDYVQNPKTGRLEFNRENVHRAKLRVDERHWQMSRLDPRLWGDRQEIQVKDDWTQLSIEERERRALKLIDMWDVIQQRRAESERFRIEGPAPIVYDPTDGDELAEREAKERARARARDEDDPPGGIGR